MSLHRNDAQMSEQATKGAQRIGEVILKTAELVVAMSRLQDETTREASKEAKAKPSKRSKKRKTLKNPPAVAPNQAGPGQVATPPAKKRYLGTAPSAINAIAIIRIKNLVSNVPTAGDGDIWLTCAALQSKAKLL